MDHLQIKCGGNVGDFLLDKFPNQELVLSPKFNRYEVAELCFSSMNKPMDKQRDLLPNSHVRINTTTNPPVIDIGSEVAERLYRFDVSKLSIHIWLYVGEEKLVLSAIDLPLSLF